MWSSPTTPILVVLTHISPYTIPTFSADHINCCLVSQQNIYSFLSIHFLLCTAWIFQQLCDIEGAGKRNRVTSWSFFTISVANQHHTFLGPNPPIYSSFLQAMFIFISPSSILMACISLRLILSKRTDSTAEFCNVSNPHVLPATRDKFSAWKETKETRFK